MAPSRGSMLATASNCDLRSEAAVSRYIHQGNVPAREMIAAASIPIADYWHARNVGGAVPQTSEEEADAL